MSLTEQYINQILADGEITDDEARELVCKWNDMQLDHNQRISDLLRDHGYDYEATASGLKRNGWDTKYWLDGSVSGGRALKVYSELNNPFKEETKPVKQSHIIASQTKQKLVWLSIVGPAVIGCLVYLL